MRDLAGKVAFVTGGASGIGLGMGRAFLEAGMKVMLADIEKPALDKALAELKAYDNRVRGVVCDVSDRAALKRAADDTLAAFGKVHVLCNNAGVGGGSGIDNISTDDWDWVLDVNLRGVVYGIAAFLPHMRAHGEGGHVVNTASMAGMVSRLLGFGPYSATKFAVVALSEGLAAELEPHGIGVSVLCPGWVRTRIHESGRNRPADLGAPPPMRNPAVVAAITQLIQSGMAPAQVAQRVVAAIRDNDFYIFTHPEMQGAVEERFARIRDAFERAPKLNQAALQHVTGAKP
ncbi:MAG TPA: SDR family NAD(P)-dependent oxidoreductase [Candidatus Cybelea sp.]|nr:SDR family NAD(P)-dependent oxidoreductase [Candidatus Cybelea sp.]